MAVAALPQSNRIPALITVRYQQDSLGTRVRIVMETGSATPAARILIVDDDPVLRRMVRFVLLGEGFALAAVASAEKALELLEREVVDLIVLDVNLPGMDGYTFCRLLRERRMMAPVLFLTGRRHIDDTIAGFDAGADDYLAKPFEPRELIARIRAILQRQARATPALDDEVLAVGGYLLDVAELTVRLPDGQVAQLTPTEQRVLQYLMRNAGQIISREQLLDSAWPEDHEGDSNEIQVYIGRLRRKLEVTDTEPCIETVRGLGYRFIKPRDGGKHS